MADEKPVAELPVVAWMEFHGDATSPVPPRLREWALRNGYKESDFEPLVRLADAQAAIAALQEQLEAARADTARLDSGRIVMHGHDEFGDPHTVEHRGMNLRAAIDEAMALDASRGTT